MTIIKKNEEKIGSQLTPIPSYYETKLKQRKEAELKRDTELKELFLRALDFYNEIYPLSVQIPPNQWVEKKQLLTFDTNKLFQENIESFSEVQLYLARLVVKYSLKERNYKKISTRDQYQGIVGLLVKLIPGGRFLEEKDRLREEINIKKNREDEIELIIAKERKGLHHRLQSNKQEKKEEIIEQPIVIEEEKEEGFICPFCIDSCKGIKEELEKIKPIKTKAGLSSHVMHTHPENYEAYKTIKEKIWAENEAK